MTCHRSTTIAKQRKFSESDMTFPEMHRLHISAQSKLNREAKRVDRDFNVLLGHASLVGELGEVLVRCSRDSIALTATTGSQDCELKRTQQRESRLSNEVYVSVRALESEDDEDEDALSDDSSSSDEDNDDYAIEYEDVEGKGLECSLLYTPSRHLQYQDFINGLSSQRRNTPTIEDARW